MSFNSILCRPPKITCRWIEEMSEAIHTQCPSQPILKCIKGSSPEYLWDIYWKNLQKNTACINHPTVQKILRFEVDYNQIRNHI